MSRVSSAFFLVAVLCGLAGMAWGSQMGQSGDHTFHAAHAHLNLLGWVSLSIMGGFYALPGTPKGGWLPWTNLVLSSIGAALMGLLLPQVMQGRVPGQAMMSAELTSIGGLVLFAVAVLGTFRKPPAG